jgi:hypothetical protein
MRLDEGPTQWPTQCPAQGSYPVLRLDEAAGDMMMLVAA